MNHLTTNLPGEPWRIVWLSQSGSEQDIPVAQLESDGTRVDRVASVEQALGMVGGDRAAAAVAVFPLAGWTPEKFLEKAQQVQSALPVILVNPAFRATEAVRLARLGAYQCLDTVNGSPEILELVASAIADRRTRDRVSTRPTEDPWSRFFIGASRAFRQVEHIIRLIAKRRCTVLVTGETGTGKEMAARALHAGSPRAHLPMVSVNCSALPEHLLEAELFGHVKGAFTGAEKLRVGRFEQANKSTLFLDEVGELPIELQAKLLRVLQEREFQRLGSSETIHVDVRVIAASNVNLPEKVRQGRFREDLYYRLNVVPLHLPCLRERREDIPLLVHHFIDKHCRLENMTAKTADQEVLDRLAHFEWPGNIRQLENAVEMAIALSDTRTGLGITDFPACISDRPVQPVQPLHNAPFLVPRAPEIDADFDYDRAMIQFECSMLVNALERSGGNKTRAADLLGLKRTTMLTKLRSLELRGILHPARIA